MWEPKFRRKDSFWKEGGLFVENHEKPIARIMGDTKRFKRPPFRNRDRLSWDGHSVHFGHGGRLLVTIEPDVAYANMWRVRSLDGTLSDMVNLARAKDAATTIALKVLNREVMEKSNVVNALAA